MRAHHHDHRSPRGGVTAAQAVALGLVAAAVGWAAWLVHERPAAEEVELLPGSMLPSSELAIVEAAFDRAQLTDHRCEEGRIWVPRPRQSAYMRALVDAEALPREFGSSLRRAIEANSPWQSRAAQEEQMRIAVQEELAHVICSMPGIERAAVLYDVAERGGLDGGLASVPVRTASVNVRTLPDVELEPTRVQAIRVLVAASIAGLDAERVAVTDLRSGRVHSGPLATPADEFQAAADPDLARRVAHEKHLTAKVRQALGFVKGATVDVSVTFAPAVASETETRAPRPQRPSERHKPAAANTPAEVDGDLAASEEEALAAADAAAATAVRAALAAAPEGPQTVVVSIAIPASYVAAAVQAACDCDPAADAAAVEARERQRLEDHVRTLLPVTPRAEDQRVAITVFPDLRGREPRVAAGPVGPVTSRRGEPSRAVRAVVETARVTWEAVAHGDFAAVPREAWLVTGAGVGLLLVLVLSRRPPADFDVRESRRQPRIDWSESTRGSRADDDSDHTASRVAA